jgi:hypothetical protein
MSANRQPTERTKVVVRGLPPTLTEEALREAIDKVIAGKYNWFSYYVGKVRWGSLQDSSVISALQSWQYCILAA